MEVKPDRWLKGLYRYELQTNGEGDTEEIPHGGNTAHPEKLWHAGTRNAPDRTIPRPRARARARTHTHTTIMTSIFLNVSILLFSSLSSSYSIFIHYFPTLPSTSTLYFSCLVDWIPSSWRYFYSLLYGYNRAHINLLCSVYFITSVCVAILLLLISLFLILLFLSVHVSSSNLNSAVRIFLWSSHNGLN